MAIKINGTTISTNRLNSTSITLEKLNGATVYSQTPLTKVWVMIYWTESQPSGMDLGIFESSNDPSDWLWELGAEFPAPDYPVGYTIAMWDGGTYYEVYQVQEV